MALTQAQQQALELSLGLDTKAAQDALSDYTTAFNRDFKKIQRANKQHNQKLNQFSKEFWNLQARAAKTQANAAKQQMESQQQISALVEKITQKQQELANAQRTGSAAAIAGLQDELKYLREKRDEFEDTLDKARELAAETRAEIEKTLESDFEFHVSAATKEIGEGIGEAFSAFASKDAFGIGAGMGKAILATMKKTGAMAITGGSKLIQKGEEKGGPMGSAMKALGGVLKTVGPALNMIGKLAPVLGMIGGALMSVVKLFLDAEANFKEFNKGILEAGGSMEYLHAAQGGVALGASNLSAALTQTYTEAVDLTGNLAMGINKEVHQQVLSTLGAEGVGLFRLQKSIEQAAASGQTSVDSFGKIVQMNVAYSRAMGVSLQEVTQLQGQLATQTGMSMEQMNIAYAQMARGAAESGIASNQFFSIIRNVSSDLALYNNRIGDAVKMLTKLGKAMSAKSAEKFMQSISNAVRGMGRVQRLQVGLLAGADKVSQIVTKDMKSQGRQIAKTIASKTGQSADELYAQFDKKGAKAFKEHLDKLRPEDRGAISEQVSNLGIKETMSKKGIYGMSQAAAEGGVAAQADLLNAALSRFSGGKSLKDAAGEIGPEQMAENLGISREQLNQMIMFNDQMDDQKTKLKEAVSAAIAGTASKEQLDTVARLKEMGVNVTDAGKASDEISKMGNQDLLDSMEEGDRKSLEEAAKIRDYAKETADFQTSLMDKFQVLIDFLMGQFYQIMMNIYGSILDIVKGMDFWTTDEEKAADLKKREELATQQRVQRSGTNYEKEAMLKSGGNIDAYKQELANTLRKSLSGSMLDRVKSGKERGAAIEAEELKAAGLKFASLEDAKKAVDTPFGPSSETLELLESTIADRKAREASPERLASKIAADLLATKTMDEQGNVSTSLDTEVLNAALTSLGVSAEQSAKINEEISKNKAAGKGAFGSTGGIEFSNLFNFLEAQGVKQTPEQQQKALDAMLKEASPEQVMQTKGSLTQKELEDGFRAAQPAAAEEYYKAGTQEGSVYTHDTTLEESLATITDILKIKGIRINQSHLNNDIKKVLKEGTLEAMEEALFEFGMIAYGSAFTNAVKDAQEAGIGASAGAIMQYAGKQGLAGKSIGGGGGGGGGGGDGGGDGGGTPTPPTTPAASSGGTVDLNITNMINVALVPKAQGMITATAEEAVQKWVQKNINVLKPK